MQRPRSALLELAAFSLSLAALGCGQARKAALDGAPQPAVSASKAASEGSWREERYSLRAQFLVEIGVAPKSTVDLDAELRVAGQPGPHARRRLQLRNVRASASQGGVQTWKPSAGEIESAFYVDYDAQGAVRELWIERDVPVQSRRVFETLATELQLAGVGEAAAWETTEVDNLGRYVARYERTPAAGGAGSRVVKRKLRYLSALPGLGGPSQPAEIAKSELALELGPAGELLRFEAAEVVSIAELSLRSGVELELGKRGVLRPESSIAFPPPGERHERYAAGQASRSSAREQDQALTAGYDFEKLIELLRAQPAAPERAELRQRLGALVRLDGAKTAAFLETLREEPKIAKDLIGALVVAGSVEAQQALITVLADTSVALDLREHTAIFSAQVRSPSEALLQALLTEFNRRGSPLREVSGLAAGTLLGVMKGDVLAQRVADDLAAQLSSSRDHDERHLLLGMLGNAGRESTLPAILAAAASKLESERAQAVRCVRGIDSAPSRALVKRALADRGLAVRLAALESVERLGAAGFRATLLSALRVEPSERARLHMLGLLAPLNDDSPATQRTLDWLAQKDRSERVRALAQKLRRPSPAPHASSKNDAAPIPGKATNTNG